VQHEREEERGKRRRTGQHPEAIYAIHGIQVTCLRTLHFMETAWELPVKMVVGRRRVKKCSTKQKGLTNLTAER